MTEIEKAKDLYLKHYKVIDTYSMSKSQKKVYSKTMATITANECFDMWCALHTNFLLSRDIKDRKQCQEVEETATYKYWIEVINQIYKIQ